MVRSDEPMFLNEARSRAAYHCAGSSRSAVSAALTLPLNSLPVGRRRQANERGSLFTAGRGGWLFADWRGLRQRVHHAPCVGFRQSRSTDGTAEGAVVVLLVRAGDRRVLHGGVGAEDLDGLTHVIVELRRLTLRQALIRLPSTSGGRCGAAEHRELLEARPGSAGCGWARRLGSHAHAPSPRHWRPSCACP